MHLIDHRILGIAMIFLLCILVAVKQVSTRSILDKPKGNFIVQLVNIFNLFFLLIVNPLAAILLITRRLPTVDPAHVSVDLPAVLIVLEILGLMLYALGFFLMAWALITLGGNYQLGGSAPRFEDKMVIGGPYRLVRHPMYTAALTISFGLACMLQSWTLLCVFCVYFLLIFLLIPMEEDGLQKSYGEPYRTYCQKTRKLIPLVY